MTISRFRTAARVAAIGAALTAPRNSGFQFGVDFKIDASGLRQLRTRTEARFAAAARAAVLETARELELRFEAATAAAGLPNLARVWNSKALNLSPEMNRLAVADRAAQDHAHGFGPRRRRRSLVRYPAIEGSELIRLQAHKHRSRIRARSPAFTFFNINYCANH